MSTVSITKKVPVVGKYDVIVCGAGSAGWIAAVTAARLGCKTALVERFGFFGGTATAGLVVPISGFFLNGHQVVGGIPFEFVKRMETAGSAIFEMPRGRISYDPEVYKLISQQMILEAGVDVYSNSYLSDCVTVNGRVTTVVIENKNGSEALAADCFIDATGDGDLCRMAGVDFLPSDRSALQPMSLCFVIDGVDISTELLKNCIHHNGKTGPSCNRVIRDCLSEAYEAGDIPQFGGPWFVTTVNGDALAVNVTRVGADACDNRSLRDAEFKLREDMFIIFEKLKNTYSEFKNGKIVSSAFQAGVRETNHIAGYYTLTGEDILQGAMFNDSIALCAHPIDIHSTRDAKQKLKRLNIPGQIPYRSMISPKSDNIICAGRCISADRVAYATVRVQATAMALGQAAGVAARVACNRDICVPDVPNEELLNSLHAVGGITECENF